MTEKDAVKCAAFADARMWFMRVDALLPRELEEFLARPPRHRPPEGSMDPKLLEILVCPIARARSSGARTRASWCARPIASRSRSGTTSR